MFNEVKNNQVKVIDFSKDSENQVDILNVLKKQKSLQFDIHRLKDIEIEQKPSSPSKREKRKNERNLVEDDQNIIKIAQTIKTKAHERFGCKNLIGEKYQELASKILL